MSEEKRPMLKSASELKGKAAESKRRAPKWPILIVLVALVVGGWVLINNTDLFTPQQEEVVVPESTRKVLIDRESGDFKSLTLSGPAIGEGYTLSGEADEEGTTYRIESAPYLKLNGSFANRMAQSVTSLTAQATVAENADDLSVYGLNAPQLTADAVYADGTTAKIELGDMVPTGYSYYMRLDGAPEVYTVSSTTYNDLGKKLTDMQVVELPLTMNAEAFKRVLIEQPGKPAVELEYDEYDAVTLNALHLRQPYGVMARTEPAQSLITSVCGMALSGYAGRAESPADYGLAEPVAHISYEQTDGALDLRVGSQADDENTYVAIDDSGDVYTMKTELLGWLQRIKVEELIGQFAGIVNIQIVDRVTVETPAKTYQMTIERKPIQNEDGTEGTEDSYFFDGTATEKKPFTAVYQEIIGLMVDKIRPENDTVTPGASIAKITFDRNDGGEMIQVEYLEYDQDYAIVRQGDRELFLIKRQKVQQMVEKCAGFEM